MHRLCVKCKGVFLHYTDFEKNYDEIKRLASE